MKEKKDLKGNNKEKTREKWKLMKKGEKDENGH